jgi:hypothetical protein
MLLESGSPPEVIPRPLAKALRGRCINMLRDRSAGTLLLSFLFSLVEKCRERNVNHRPAHQAGAELCKLALLAG